MAFVFLAIICVAVSLLAGLGRWLRYENEPEPATYIVPLAGNNRRLVKAIELFKQNYAPTLLLSIEKLRLSPGAQWLAELGCPSRHSYEYRMLVLTHLGVPPDAVRAFGEGHISTAEEAEALRDHIGSAPTKIILVTSPFHARRTKVIFEKTMPNVRFLVVPTGRSKTTSIWRRLRKSAMSISIELIKLAFFSFGGVFRAASARSRRH
jgi:uncharacterized SAM-binding protein YcdF (DUF218 family)